MHSAFMVDVQDNSLEINQPDLALTLCGRPHIIANQWWGWGEREVRRGSGGGEGWEGCYHSFFFLEIVYEGSEVALNVDVALLVALWESGEYIDKNIFLFSI